VPGFHPAGEPGGSPGLPGRRCGEHRGQGDPDQAGSAAVSVSDTASNTAIRLAEHGSFLGGFLDEGG
jgi:hypothetical protein